MSCREPQRNPVQHNHPRHHPASLHTLQLNPAPAILPNHNSCVTPFPTADATFDVLKPPNADDLLLDINQKMDESEVGGEACREAAGHARAHHSQAHWTRHVRRSSQELVLECCGCGGMGMLVCWVCLSFSMCVVSITQFSSERVGSRGLADINDVA